MAFAQKRDLTKENLDKLIGLYDEYRAKQYEIFRQYNLVLEDPKLDEVYTDIEPLTKYRKYIENDLNGTPEYSSTTTIIKELRKMRDTYEQAVGNSRND